MALRNNYCLRCIALHAYVILILPAYVTCDNYPDAFDIVTMALKPTCVNRQMVNSVNKFMIPKPRAIHIVAARGCAVFNRYANNVVCHEEDNLVDNLTSGGVADWLVSRFKARGENEAARVQRRSTWFYQQFLKLAVASHIPGLSDYFLIFDSDMIALKPLTWFVPAHAARGSARRSMDLPYPFVRDVHGKSEAGCVNTHPFRMLVHTGGWRPRYGYMRTYEILTGREILYDRENASFVTHHVLVYKPYMAEFLASITTEQHRNEPLGWALSVVDAVARLPGIDEVIVGFSEFWSYLSWVQDRYPCAFIQTEQRVWTRNPVTPPRNLDVAVVVGRGDTSVRICCPTAANIEKTRSRGFYFTGYELGHIRWCNYHHPAFQDGYAPWYLGV